MDSRMAPQLATNEMQYARPATGPTFLALRVAMRFLSADSTRPKPTWSTRGGCLASLGRMPALRAEAYTSWKCEAWPASVT